MRKELWILSLIALLYCWHRSECVSAQVPSRTRIWLQGACRYIESNGIPDHATGEFPNRYNPNTMRPQAYRFQVPARPELAPVPIPVRGMLFGVALNGIPFDPGTAEVYESAGVRWHYEAIGPGINLGLDRHRAHVQPTGAYHYHGPPRAQASRMMLVGWAADGFPIYNQRDRDGSKPQPGYQLRRGRRPCAMSDNFDGTFVEDYEWVDERPARLDFCNGHFGPTPEFPQGSYHYHLTDGFPYVPRWFAGFPDESMRKRHPPPPWESGR